MFDVGFWELLVIGVIALIVVGPDRLPGLMRTVGLWVGRARATMYSIREEVEREVNTQGLRDTERAIRESVEDTAREVSDTARSADVSQDVRDSLEGATRNGSDAQSTSAETDAPAGDAEASEGSAPGEDDGAAIGSEPEKEQKASNRE